MDLYFFFSVHEPLYHEVAVRLRDRYGVSDLGGFLWGNDQRDFLEKAGFPWRRLDVFSDWLRELPGWKPDLRILERAEEKYGAPNLAVMTYADRHLLHRSYDEMLALLETAVRHLERIFDEARPGAVLFESVDGLLSYLLYSVAKRAGVRTIHIDTGRIPGRAAVTRTPTQEWDDVDRLFEERLHRPIGPAEKERAEAFLARYRSERPRTAAPNRFSFPAVRLDDLRRIAEAGARYLRDPKNPTLRSPARLVRQKLVRMARHGASSRLGLFEEPIAGDRYVVFPLHFQPEASTLVRAPYFLDQIALVEDIAKALPIGYRLYVKEHFFSLGHRPVGEYLRLGRLWNVRLIDPLADPHDLIERSAAVFTITGTMGWEGVLFEKPVVTFGDCFYNTFPLVTRAGLVPKTQWAGLFKDALSSFRPNRDLLLKYVAAVLDGTFEGFFSMANPRMAPEVLTRENVENLTRIVAVELGRAPDPRPGASAAIRGPRS